MLVISNKQLDVFRQAEIDKFVMRMVRHLNRLLKNQTKIKNTNNLSQWIQLGIKKAAEHGITTESDVRRYLEVFLMENWQFDVGTLQPQVKEILINKKMSGQMKINLLEQLNVSKISGETRIGNIHE